MIPPDETTRRLAQKWSGRKQRYRVRQDGHYYSTCEILCTVVGGAKGACVVHIPKGEYAFFDRAVGDLRELLLAQHAGEPRGSDDHVRGA